MLSTAVYRALSFISVDTQLVIIVVRFTVIVLGVDSPTWWGYFC